MSFDDESDEDMVELDISSPEVVNKYKSAAAIVNKALQLVLSECKPNVKIVDLCEKGDSYIIELTGSMYKNASKKIKRGVAFPTCLSVNNTVCHFSPFASDETILKEGDILKLDMGCHIDGFIAVVAHTHVLQQGPVTGRAADVIAAANTAAEVALRLVRPGKKNQEVTEAIQKVAAAYDCKIVEGVLSHQLKQFMIDGNKVVLSVANPDTRVVDAEFEENEVYAINIVTSTGDGKPKLLDEKQTTIYRAGNFSKITPEFPIMPFSARDLRGLEDKLGRLCLVQCVNRELLQPYPVLHEKPGDFVAHIKFTVLLMPNRSDRITSHSLQELQPTKKVDDPAIKAWLALPSPVKSEKKIEMAGVRRFCSSFSSTRIFKFATASPRQILEISPSVLSKLRSGHELRQPTPPRKLHLSVPNYLTPEETRAAFHVLFNMILIGGSASASSIALQISEFLNRESQMFTIKLEFDWQEDACFYELCWPDIIGRAIGAVIDSAASSLSVVALVVAALSCEALKIDPTTAFNLFMDSGDRNSHQDTVSVASDFKALLNGSKMLGGNRDCDAVSNIPEVYGNLRSVCKDIQELTQLELNSTLIVGDDAMLVQTERTKLFLFLASALECLGQDSWQRAKLCLDNPSLDESFNVSCPNPDDLKNLITSADNFVKEEDYIKSLHEVYRLLEAVRKILSWEASIAYISLAESLLIKPDKKNSFGKGTSVLMEFIKDRLTSDVTSDIDGDKFLSLLDLKDASFDKLLNEVKQVVDCKESRRLPKGTCDF